MLYNCFVVIFFGRITLLEISLDFCLNNNVSQINLFPLNKLGNISYFQTGLKELQLQIIESRRRGRQKGVEKEKAESEIQIKKPKGKFSQFVNE